MEDGEGRVWKIPLLTLQTEVGFSSFDQRCDFDFSVWVFLI